MIELGIALTALLVGPAGGPPQTPEQEPVVGLVLSAGTAKATFEIGVLKYLYEVEGIRPQIITGSSAGALNAMKLSEGPAAMAELEGLWRSIRGGHDVFHRNPAIRGALEGLKKGKWEILREWVKAGFKLNDSTLHEIVGELRENLGPIESVYVTDPLRNLVASNMRLDRSRTSGIALRMAVVDLHSGDLFYVDQFGKAYSGADPRRVGALQAKLEVLNAAQTSSRPTLVSADKGSLRLSRLALTVEENLERITNPPPIDSIDAVMASFASSAIPGGFPPVWWEGHQLVDGGVREMLPLDACLDLGATEVYVIMAGPRDLTYGLPTEGYAGSFKLLATVARTLEVAFDETIADDLRRADEPGVHVIAPPLQLQESMDFGRHITALNIWYGYEIARQYFEGSMTFDHRSGYVLWDTDGPAYPFDQCVSTLKELAHELDTIDGLLREKQRYVDMRELLPDSSFDYEYFADLVQQKIDAARRRANQLLATLNRVGCPRVPGLTGPAPTPVLNAGLPAKGKPTVGSVKPTTPKKTKFEKN